MDWNSDFRSGRPLNSLSTGSDLVAAESIEEHFELR